LALPEQLPQHVDGEQVHVTEYSVVCAAYRKPKEKEEKEWLNNHSNDIQE
jgi:hypothetical protein